MAQSNKILTVSYGTFSCTLEGFDNPFAAMQSIAEYFRDLAAEDRYFGAEPPQPDARMLHQIAEREVRHRVDAQVADDGVVLRQMSDTDEAGFNSAPPEAAAPTTSEPSAAEAVAENIPHDSEAAPDRLARIRGTAVKVPAERDRPHEEDEQVGDEPNESVTTAFAQVEDAELNDTPAEALADQESQPSLTVAAKAAAASATLDPAPSTDEPDGLSQVFEARHVGDADGAEPAEKVPSGEPDRPDDVAATSEASEPPQEKARGDEVELARLMAAISPAAKTSDGQEAFDEDRADNDAQSTVEEAEDWVELEVEDTDGTPRVVRMSRAEFERAIANGDLEEIEDDEAEMSEAESKDAIREILAETSLNDADAAALAAELAAVELEPGAHDTSAAEDEPKQVRGDRTVTRLLDETDAQMGEPGGHRRRTAIQHLRAAVAATKADGGLRDRSPVKDASIQKFRDDLQKAVRPSHPGAAGGSEPPVNPLGPLVLVSSQRIDASVEMVRPVRPLRDDPAHETPVEASEPQEQATFPDFAAKLGAYDLPALLEAAAAYSKIVEGQEGAPRPVLVRRATAVAPAGTASREEGLKSFGQLLRAGRLRKIDAGRFALADDAEMEKRARAAQ